MTCGNNHCSKSSCCCGSYDLKKELLKHIGSLECNKSNLIPILHSIQKGVGYVPREWSIELAKLLSISLAEIYEVLTFYHYFKLSPQGKHSIQICTGTACHVKGSGAILDAVKRHLAINENETTQDGEFQLETVRCIGACGLAPAVTVDGEVFGKCTAEKLIEKIEQIRQS